MSISESSLDYKSEALAARLIIAQQGERIEKLQEKLAEYQRRERAAVAEIVRIITNESRCDLCGRLLGNGDCEIYSAEEERCDPLPRYMRRGVAEGEKV